VCIAATVAFHVYRSAGALRAADESLKPVAAKEQCQKIPPSKLALQYLDNLHGIEIGASTQNSFGLKRAVNVDFSDEQGGFFDTADDHEALIARPKSLQDNALPSGGAMTATVLLKLGALTGDARYTSAAEGAVATVAPLVGRYPTAFAQWLSAIAFQLADPVEIGISGDPSTADARALIDVVRETFRPFAVLAAGSAGASSVPLLVDRPQRDGQATAYVCRHFACRAPVTEPVDLRTQLASEQ
jgi:uncharacterized protein YyaL (SSP411 family)